MTAKELIALWSSRDDRYASRRPHQRVTEPEIDALMVWRMKEVQALPASEQPEAMQNLARWSAPWHFTQNAKGN